MSDGRRFAILAAMGPVVRYLMVDCLGNPHQLAQFWAAALRRPLQGSAEGCFVELYDREPQLSLFFQEVSERQHAKGRLHLHLNPVKGTLGDEIDRLTGLGAAVVSRHTRTEDVGWVVMTDPEGNEFCVDSSDEEVAAWLHRHRMSEE
jgi:predicted enzyme related to lactoylglutathione lyase